MPNQNTHKNHLPHKLNQSGLAHLFYPMLGLLVVIVIAGAGFYVYQQNNSGAGGHEPVPRCSRGKTLVNAKPDDFVNSEFKAAARRGKGLICVKNPNGREKVKGSNRNTIVAFYKCNSGSVFAYDKNNPDGTGWNGGNKWMLKTDQRLKERLAFTSAPDRITWYCIGNQHIGHNLYTNLKGKTGITSGWGGPGAGHTYYFVPYAGYSNDQDKYVRCRDATSSRPSAYCNTQYWFTYNGQGDQPRGTRVSN